MQFQRRAMTARHVAHFERYVGLDTVRAPQGEFVTWAKLSAIKANLAIELTFDECLKTVKEWEASAAAPYERRGSLHRGMSRVPSFAAIKTSHSMLNVTHTGAMAHAASGDLDGQQQHAPANPWPAAAAEGYSADAAAPDSGASPTATAAERALSSGEIRASNTSGP